MRALQCLSLAFLFLASAVPSKAQEGAAEARVVVREGAPLTVECGLRVEQRAEWQRDGTAVPTDMRAGETTAGGRLTARLHVAAARAHHAGLYSCGREPTQQVRVVVQPAPGHDFATSEPAAAPSGNLPPADNIPPVVQVFNLVRIELGHKFTLNCTELSSVKTEDIVWKKNGTDINNVWDLAGRYEVKEDKFQMTSRSNEDDFGNYTCSKRGVSGDAGAWQLQVIPHAKMPPNTNVVEGQKLKLQCKLTGKPYPPVTWTYSNETEGANAVDVNIALNGRARLQPNEQGVDAAELVIESAERTDAGIFMCIPGDSKHNATTTLRVKDMYAALWPFLGICIEVFILCAVILVYEKRRTKPELDDSDTDNHDQKKS